MNKDQGQSLSLLIVATLPTLATLACAFPGQLPENNAASSTPDPLKGTVDAQGTFGAEQSTQFAQTLQALSAALTPVFTPTSTESPTATPAPDQLNIVADAVRAGMACDGGVNIGTLTQSVDDAGNRRLGVNLIGTTNEGECTVELTQVINTLADTGVSREKFGIGVTNMNNEVSALLSVYDPLRQIYHQSGAGFGEDGFNGGEGLKPYMPLSFAEEARGEISFGWDNGAEWTVRIEIRELDNGEMITFFIVELPAQQ